MAHARLLVIFQGDGLQWLDDKVAVVKDALYHKPPTLAAGANPGR